MDMNEKEQRKAVWRGNKPLGKYNPGEQVRDFETGRLMGTAVNAFGAMTGAWECGKGHLVTNGGTGCSVCSDEWTKEQKKKKKRQ